MCLIKANGLSSKPKAELLHIIVVGRVHNLLYQGEGITGSDGKVLKKIKLSHFA
jgi:hypothetical protein